MSAKAMKRTNERKGTSDRARILRGRAEAEIAVEHALHRAEGDDPRECHLETLSDALDALEDRTYGAALEIAEKSLSERCKDKPRDDDLLVSLRSRFEVLKGRPFPKED